MLPAGVQLWKLSEGGDPSFGLACSAEGLFLGRTPLVDRHERRFSVRPRADLERLLDRAYRAEIDLDRLLPGLRTVAAALGEQNLALAQIAAVQLRLLDLPDLLARSGMEAEDLLIKRARERAADWLARTGWDPAEHPRAGVPPNPGWFAPAEGSDNHPPTRTAQEEDERAPEEMLDPLAEVRQKLWATGIATLREIDPGNPQLNYLTAPGWVPSQADLDSLARTTEAASIKRITDKVMPGGVPIGQRGNNPRVRTLPGGLTGAEDLFRYLRVGGTVQQTNSTITVVRLPGNVGAITFRATSTSGSPAVDINVPRIPIRKIHFP